MVYAVAGKLLGASSSKDEITLKSGVYGLDDDLLVRESDHQAVLRCIAGSLSLVHRFNRRVGARTTYSSPALRVACVHSLYVILGDCDHKISLRHTICLALATATILHLEPREVGIGLDFLDEWHLKSMAQVRTLSASKRYRSHPSPSRSNLAEDKGRI